MLVVMSVVCSMYFCASQIMCMCETRDHIVPMRLSSKIFERSSGSVKPRIF